MDASNLRELLTREGPQSWRELTRKFDIAKGPVVNRLRRLVRGLIRTGEIVELADGRYSLIVDATFAEGVVEERDGRLAIAGVALPLETEASLRVGDRVEVQTDAASARVVRVLEPSAEPIYGIYQVERGVEWVESMDPRIKGRVRVDPPFLDANEGDVVAVVLLANGGERRFVGSIREVLEPRNEADRAALTLLRSHRVPDVWPEALAGYRAPEGVTHAELAGRSDLRDLPLVTIDGETARDFDDAVFAEPRKRGGWRLVVAIADVAHYVVAGGELDGEAYVRGNSVYLPDRVIPMLPEGLSNGICSLRPDGDRLALACDMTISATGRLSGYRFCNAVIRSHARLTYGAVGDFLDGAPLQGDVAEPVLVAESLSQLRAVYNALRSAREVRGALDFETHEADVVLEDGRVVDIVPVTRHDAHRLIEEAMIAANVAAARFLEKQGAGVMYRIHEPPAALRLEQLSTALGQAGIARLPEPLTPKELQTVLDAISRLGFERAWIFEMLVLRSLAQARYGPEPLGHFGLALPKYAHFTSPIRRYADLVVHRAIKRVLARSPDAVGDAREADAGGADDPEWLAAVGAHISMTERRAEDVSRAVDGWLKCAFLADRVGDEFDGVVMGVTEFGLFVELDGTYVQGLLHVSNLGRDYFTYQAHALALVAERSGQRFTLGDQLRVRLVDVSIETAKLDLHLVGGGPRARKRAVGPGKGRRAATQSNKGHGGAKKQSKGRSKRPPKKKGGRT